MVAAALGLGLAAGCTQHETESLRLPPDPAVVAERKAAGLQSLEPAERDAAERASRAGVSLMSWGLELGGTGSGTAISPDGKVLTAWHVLNLVARDERGHAFLIGDKPAFIEKHFRGTYQGVYFDRVKVVSLCPEQDMAIIDIGIPTPDYIRPSSDGPRRGDRVLVLGSSGGEAAATSGLFHAPGQIGRSPALVLEAPAFAGDSGGAVLNSRGELLGVIRASAVERERPAGVRVQGTDKALCKGRRLTAAMPFSPLVMESMLKSDTRRTRVELTGTIEDWKTLRLQPRRG